jgi:hypothetical protein
VRNLRAGEQLGQAVQRNHRDNNHRCNTSRRGVWIYWSDTGDMVDEVKLPTVYIWVNWKARGLLIGVLGLSAVLMASMKHEVLGKASEQAWGDASSIHSKSGP